MNIDSYIQRHQSQIFRILFVIVTGFLLIEIFFGIKNFSEGYPSYESMPISDWLINYEGGFVRRGFTGQILLYLYRIAPHHIVYSIIAIYFCSLLVLLYIVYTIFKKNGWSLFIAIFPVCISISFLGVRRDYLMLILCFFVFHEFRNFLRTNSISHIICANIIASVAILMHEVYFFFTIPILFLFSITRQAKTNTWTIVNAIKLWFPTLATMIIVCLYKGNDNIAQSIWQSWTPCFSSYPISEGIPPMGEAIKWLSYDTSYAIPFHIKKFWISNFYLGIPSLPINIYVLMSIYLIVTRLNTVNMGLWATKKVDSKEIGNYLILQLVFISPMLGFLSCDMSRIIMYWTLSSLFAYHCLHEYVHVPHFINSLSQKLQRTITRSKISNKWLYLLILLSLPIGRFEGADIQSAFCFIPYGWRMSFWNIISEHLHIIQ